MTSQNKHTHVTSTQVKKGNLRNILEVTQGLTSYLYLSSPP